MKLIINTRRTKKDNYLVDFVCIKTKNSKTKTKQKIPTKKLCLFIETNQAFCKTAFIWNAFLPFQHSVTFDFLRTENEIKRQMYENRITKRIKVHFILVPPQNTTHIYETSKWSLALNENKTFERRPLASSIEMEKIMWNDCSSFQKS